MTIKRKLIAIQLSIAASVLVLTTGVFVYNEIEQFRTSLVNTTTTTALLIGENSVSTLRFFDQRAAEEVLASLRVEEYVTQAAIYDIDEVLFASYARSGHSSEALPEERPEVGHRFVDGYLELVEVIQSEGETFGAVMLRTDLGQIDANIQGFLEKVALAMVGIVLVAVGLALILQRTISQPILDLVSATRRVSETNDYSQRVKVQTQDELGTLSTEFNSMLGLIEKRDASLLDAQEGLERRVEERTHELNEAVERAEAANRSKSSFLANISHEIRTPLNAISGFAEILGSSLTDAVQKSHVKEIQGSCRSLLTLVTRIIDFAKSESDDLVLEMSEVDLLEIFEDLASRHLSNADAKSIKLDIDLDPAMPGKLWLDGDRFSKIIDSLVDNAIKFTAEGKIVVSARSVPSESDENAADLSFDVQDSGVGIPEDQTEEIFKAFTQAAGQSINEYGGTGMGLTMTRRIVEAMGGTISVTSQVGVGSTFHVALPAVSVMDTQTIGDLLDEMAAPAEDDDEIPDQPAWSPESLSESERAKLPELAATLSGHTDHVAELRSTMTINEIEDFAAQVKPLGETYNFPPLTRWATDLITAVETFDMDIAESRLDGYGDLVRLIQPE